MSGEWPELPIGDVATVIGGGTPSTKDAVNFNGSIPWLTPKDLSGYPYRCISRGERNISEKGLMIFVLLLWLHISGQSKKNV